MSANRKLMKSSYVLVFHCLRCGVVTQVTHFTELAYAGQREPEDVTAVQLNLQQASGYGVRAVCIEPVLCGTCAIRLINATIERVEYKIEEKQFFDTAAAFTERWRTGKTH